MRTELNEIENRIDIFDDEGRRVGMLEYTLGAPGLIYVGNTYVFLGNEGKGYATMLLDALVDYARETGKKISPVCSFAKQAFKKHPEKYSGVVAG